MQKYCQLAEIEEKKPEIAIYYVDETGMLLPGGYKLNRIPEPSAQNKA
jgi:hypothetical protein